MRVTSGMMVDGVLSDLRGTWARLSRCERQLASGKRISSPSDDPVGVVRALGLRSNLNQVERYLNNVDDGRNWIEMTDTALAQVGDILQRARELAVSTAGSVPDSTLRAAEAEVSRLFEQLAEVGNTSYAGRYIFAGQETLTKPFTVDTASSPPSYTYGGDSGSILREVGPGVSMQVNRPGDEALVPAFDAIRDYLNTLRGGAGAKSPEAVLEGLDGAIDHVLGQRAHVGADGHRLELARARLQDMSFQLKSLLSETEDADMAEVITHLTTEEAAYRAALEAGARIIQPSLLDFLR